MSLMGMAAETRGLNVPSALDISATMAAGKGTDVHGKGGKRIKRRGGSNDWMRQIIYRWNGSKRIVVETKRNPKPRK